ncbi:hypothetical protein KUTeg_012200 [Tegillarca granosa]|uniref:Uncharacterized protein n=1 Tax=Tegillarca granosa TaxID=220873 RepID=A0ABQ9F407_TEGGR|nr:hypothetical protein KUTeg_012200 [Tegillarca granosa]
MSEILGSTGIQIPMGTLNTNTNTLLNQNTANTRSAAGIQIPMNTFNENTNSLLNKNNQNTGGGVQIPFSGFNANTDTNSLVNDNTLNTVPGSTTNFFNANMKGLPNENILKPGSVKAVSNQLPNKNSLLTTVNVPNTNNVVMQNNPQEFTQIGQTAFDNNPNRAFNPNLNSALGFGNNNNNNIPTNLPHGIPCVDSRIKPAYIKTRTGNMVFDPTHFKLGSSKLRCASGTGFSLETCACEFITDSTLAAFYASIGAADWATRCNEDFSIDFNRGIYDTSFDQWYVDVHGVNTSHGVGVFTGIANTSVALPRYRGYDLKTIAFEFRFRSNVTNREHPHPLFTNCEGHSGHYKTHNEEPTYGVILNSNRPKMTFFVTYEKARPKQAFGDPVLHTQYISMDVNPLVWNTVRFSYDGNFLTAYLNGQKESKPAKGVIADRMEHQIVIGHCLRYGQFVGEIDDVKVYTHCIPSRF